MPGSLVVSMPTPSHNNTGESHHSPHPLYKGWRPGWGVLHSGTLARGGGRSLWVMSSGKDRSDSSSEGVPVKMKALLAEQYSLPNVSSFSVGYFRERSLRTDIYCLTLALVAVTLFFVSSLQ